MALLANWGTCSDELTIELMRYDASNHEDGSSFDTWKETDICPFVNVRYQRSANFTECQSLWPGWNARKKVKSAYQLMQMLIAEHCDTTETEEDNAS